MEENEVLKNGHSHGARIKLRTIMFANLAGPKNLIKIIIITTDAPNKAIAGLQCVKDIDPDYEMIVTEMNILEELKNKGYMAYAEDVSVDEVYDCNNKEFYGY